MRNTLNRILWWWSVEVEAKQSRKNDNYVIINDNLNVKNEKNEAKEKNEQEDEEKKNTVRFTSCHPQAKAPLSYI